MPRYHFHLTNGVGLVRDEDGVDLSGGASAHHHAIDNIRSIVAEEARTGIIDLTGHIEVTDEAGNSLAMVNFIEAFDTWIGDEHTAYGNIGTDEG